MKICIFGRKCLKVCLAKYRTASSNFKDYVNNNTIYDEANFPRIDNFMLKLNHDYYSRINSINNQRLNSFTISTEKKLMKMNRAYYFTPQAFVTLDKQGVIQDTNNVPTIYHWSRHKSDKSMSL